MPEIATASPIHSTPWNFTGTLARPLPDQPYMALQEVTGHVAAHDGVSSTLTHYDVVPGTSANRGTAVSFGGSFYGDPAATKKAAQDVLVALQQTYGPFVTV